MSIHSTAMVDSSAQIDPTAEIGPYCVVGPRVVIEEGCILDNHVSIYQDTVLGAGTRVWPFASIGSDPQDLKYQGEPTRLIIGKNNKIREFVTMNRGSGHGGGSTIVGDGGLFMAYAHVAHDCRIGNGVIMANSVHLGGHVVVEDYVSIGGVTAVHQFTQIGTRCFVGGCSAVAQDLPPYTLCEGNRAVTHGLNVIGLKRACFPLPVVKALKDAYRIIFRENLMLQEALAKVSKEVPDLPEVRIFCQFIEKSERGVPR